MSDFSLDSIDPLSVVDYSGFDLPDDVSTVGILGDGSSLYNAVVQSPGTKLPEAQLAGRTTDDGIIAALRALRLTESLVTFTDPETTRTVLVSQFHARRNAHAYFLWDWTMTLLELPAPGS